jgi:hypothetical protein
MTARQTRIPTSAIEEGTGACRFAATSDNRGWHLQPLERERLAADLIRRPRRHPVSGEVLGGGNGLRGVVDDCEPALCRRAPSPLAADR